MKFPSIISLCVGASVVSASSLPNNYSKPFNWKKTDFFLAFGDSYTFIQGTYGHQNYSFIGDVQNFAFTPEQLLSNKIVQNQTGTSAGGPNWVEYLTGCFSGLPSNCKTQLWDFAFAGSDISVDFTPLHHPYTISLQNQIIQWASYALPVLKPKLSKALVAIFIGINDINDSSKFTFPRNGTTGFPSLYKATIEIEFKSLETVYNAGYRNYLFMKLPPLDKTPSNLVSAHPLPNRTMIDTWNNQLQASATQFEATHPGTKAMVFDTYSYLSQVLENPTKYNIKNTTNFCPRYDAPDIATNYAAYGCQPISQYFWYNSGHITYRVHEILAKGVADFLNTQR